MPKSRIKTRYNAKLGRRLRADIRKNGFAWNEYGKNDPTSATALRELAFPQRRCKND